MLKEAAIPGSLRVVNVVIHEIVASRWNGVGTSVERRSEEALTK